MPVSIAIAEDNRFALRSCLDKLAQVPHLKVTLTAGDGQALLTALETKSVDVVLMDIEMPLMDGIETTAAVKYRYPHIKVIMLTTFDDDEKIFQAIMAGASGYLLKEESSEGLIAAIHDALSDGAAMSAGIAMRVLKMLRQTAPVALPVAQPVVSADYGLSDREIELLEQLKAGHTYERIATHLNIASGTVRKHIENIYRKLRVSNKLEAVQKAFGRA
ncbi:MAG: response regulator transcription factor [Sphingobacteriales bacterium]|nr:MAG: response regulator transcription factor [Sphingobacteriales bacterium]